VIQRQSGKPFWEELDLVAKLVRKEFRGLQDLKDPLDQRVKLAHKGFKEFRVIRDFKEIAGLQV
jgi:hypothetical protein